MPDGPTITITIGDAAVVAVAKAAEAGFNMVTAIVNKTPDGQFQASAEVYIEAMKLWKAWAEQVNKLFGVK